MKYICLYNFSIQQQHDIALQLTKQGYKSAIFDANFANPIIPIQGIEYHGITKIKGVEKGVYLEGQYLQQTLDVLLFNKKWHIYFVLIHTPPGLSEIHRILFEKAYVLILHTCDLEQYIDHIRNMTPNIIGIVPEYNDAIIESLISKNNRFKESYHMGIFNEKELQNILSNYRLQNNIKCLVDEGNCHSFIQNKSATTRKVFIQDGYLLKEMPDYIKSIESLTDLHNHLSSLGLPVPKLIRNKDGKLFTAMNNKFYTLQARIEGHQYTGTEIEIKNLGKCLSYFHNKTKNIKNNKIQENIFYKVLKFIDNLLPELKNRAILNKTQEQSIVRYMKITRKQVIALKNSAYRKGYKKISQVVHGDFHPLNVILAKDRSVKSLIDLDNLSINNPLDDVVRCLLHIAYFQFKEHSTNFKEIPNNFDEYKAQLFLQDYLQNMQDTCYLDYFYEVLKTITIELSTLGILRQDFQNITQVLSAIDAVDSFKVEI